MPKANNTPLTAEQKALADKEQWRVPLIVRSRRYRYIAAQYDDINDAIQQGYIGLCNAVKTYDPSRSKFATYLDRAVGFQLRRGLYWVKKLNRFIYTELTDDLCDARLLAPDVFWGDVEEKKIWRKVYHEVLNYIHDSGRPEVRVVFDRLLSRYNIPSIANELNASIISIEGLKRRAIDIMRQKYASKG